MPWAAWIYSYVTYISAEDRGKGTLSTHVNIKEYSGRGSDWNFPGPQVPYQPVKLTVSQKRSIFLCSLACI
jgi:hypothetical protein